MCVWNRETAETMIAAMVATASATSAQGGTARKLNAAAAKTTSATTTRQKYIHPSRRRGLGIVSLMPSFWSLANAFGPEICMRGKYVALFWQNAIAPLDGQRR